MTIHETPGSEAHRLSPVADLAATPASRLSPAELRALRTYAETGDVKLAAVHSGLAYQTVKDQLYSAYRKLDVCGAIAAFRAVGWLRIPEVAA